MFKNTASQKLTVIAFADAGHASLDAGEPVTGDSANITCKVEQDDDGTRSAVADTNPTETEGGQYVFDLTAAETNGDKLTFYPTSSTAGVQVACQPANAIYTRPPNFAALGIESDGMAHADLKEWKGSTPASLTDTDKVQTSVQNMATDVITAAAASAGFGAEIAALVESYIVNEGDATATMQALADKIAADWVAGDASPLAIVAALKADSEWSDLAAMATKVATLEELLDAMFHGYGTISAINSITEFEVTGANIPTTSAAVKGSQMIVVDSVTSTVRQTRRVTDYDDGPPATVTMTSESSIAGVGDKVYFLSQLTFSGLDNTKQVLQTTAAGHIGIDWSNVDSPDSVVDLSNTTLKNVNDSPALSAAERNAMADAILSRAVSNVADSADADSLAALIMATFGSSISGTTWTIRKPDDSTFRTLTLTFDDTADPVVGVT